MNRRLFAAIVVLIFVLGLGLSTHAQDSEMFIDVEWYRENQLLAADRWNGGPEGITGMGAYQPDFSGFFHVALDQEWNQMRMRATTAVAQSRGIYMNIEAYRTATEAGLDGERFLQAAIIGTGFLLEHFYDPEYGGFYWEVDGAGFVANDMKQGYGNVHPLFVLAHLYGITQDPAYLEVALAQVDTLNTHFADPDYPGAMLPGFTRDFRRIIGVNNVDSFTHLFEAYLALYDVTEGEQQEAIADLIVLHGNFLTEHLYHDQEGFDDRGYVAYNYDQEWQPSQIPYTREMQWAGALHATTGHNIELAYLLSRAVERGFNPEWLETADKLLKFCTEYALHPVYGGMIYDITDYEGQPLDGNPDNPLFLWWPQAETARALLHFTVARGQDFRTDFKAVETLFNQHLTDPMNGGLYHALDATRDLEPVDRNKGDIWKTNYHYTMFFREVLRLADEYPARIAELNSKAVGS